MSGKPLKKIIVKSLQQLPLNVRKALLKGNTFKRLQLIPTSKEEIIYTSDNAHDILSGEYQSLVLKNKINFLTKDCVTYAVCKSSDLEVTRNSIEITKLIGQKNYNILLTALCSILSQELKIRTILSLLTEPRKTKEVSCQTDIAHEQEATALSEYIFTPCQDPQTICNTIKNIHQVEDRAYYKTNKNKHKNHEMNVHEDVIQNNILINSNQTLDTHKNYKLNENSCTDSKKDNHDFTSVSVGASIVSICATEFNENDYYKIDTIFNSKIMVPFKPQDQFHIAVPEILKHLVRWEQEQLIKTQAYIDWRFCLEVNDDGYMPIHLAAIHSEESVLRRHCVVLRMRGASVDVPSRNKRRATALSLCSADACARALLRAGARLDAAGARVLHAAAETRVLDAIVDECERLSSETQGDNQDLLSQAREQCLTFNEDGFTPLMLAARRGLGASAQRLLALQPAAAAAARPHCGDTALHLAVAAAARRMRDANLSEVPDGFSVTITALLDAGARPHARNVAGVSALDLLADANIAALSQLVSAKVCAVRYNSHPAAILVKNEDGGVQCVDVNNGAKRKRRCEPRNGNKRVPRIFSL